MPSVLAPLSAARAQAMSEDRPKSSTRARRFRALLREAGKQCNAGIDDDRVQLLATLRFGREQLQARMVDVGDVDANDLLRISEEMRELMPPPPAPAIKLEFV